MSSSDHVVDAYEPTPAPQPSSSPTSSDSDAEERSMKTIDALVASKARRADAADVRIEMPPHAKLPPAPAMLAFRNLTVATRVSKKQILRGVSGTIAKGKFTAVMGPSGCGKSSLLNTLARRLDAAVGVVGELRMEGREYSKRTLKECSGYVMQDDLLNGLMTVLETLTYTAWLKLPPTSSAPEREARVREVAAQMGLAHILGVIVGDPLHKGVSGGERKRLCIAMELLTKPPLLFLDEPTSGLDSVTALSLCKTLKRLAASEGVTIVCTIHQPQAKIFHIFDELVLLKQGLILYNGPADGALDAFAAYGYECPTHENPADFLLDSITPNSAMNDANVSLTPEAEAKMVQRFSSHDVDLGDAGASGAARTEARAFLPWHAQVYVLFVRSLHELRRRTGYLVIQLVQTVVMAILIGGAFFQIGDTQSSIVRRTPICFFCVINQGVFGALLTINSFPAERMLSLRERASGMYSASSYFIAKTSAETLPNVAFPSLFAFVVYFMLGFDIQSSKFVIFWLFMVLTNLAATSMALAVSALARTTDLSVIVLPILLEICRLFGGFFLAPAILPVYFSWLDALSYVKYAYTGVALNELQGLVLRCTPAQLRPDGSCPVTRGEQTIEALGLDFISIGGCIGALIAMIAGFRIIAYLGVRFRTH